MKGVGVSQKFPNVQTPLCSSSVNCRIDQAPAKELVSLRVKYAKVDLEPKNHSFTTIVIGRHNLGFPNEHNCSVFSNE